MISINSLEKPTSVNKMGLQAVFYLDQSLVLKTLDGVLFEFIFNVCIYWSTRLTHLSWSLTQYWDHSITTIITLHVTLFKYELSRGLLGGSDKENWWTKLLAGS